MFTDATLRGCAAAALAGANNGPVLAVQARARTALCTDPKGAEIARVRWHVHRPTEGGGRGAVGNAHGRGGSQTPTAPLLLARCPPDVSPAPV
eukprot:4318837-Alexandrium_andersonii.AAC.1